MAVFRRTSSLTACPKENRYEPMILREGKMKYLFAIGLLIVSLSGACYNVKAMMVGKMADAVTLFAQPSKSKFPFGEAVHLDITVANKGPKIVKLWETNPARDFEFEVKDSKRLIIPLNSYGKKMREATEITRNILVTLKPGEEYRRRIEISKLFDLPKAGDYSVKVKRVVFERTDEKTATLVSKSTIFSVIQ